VQVIGQLFRGKFLDGLRRLYADGQLALDGPCADLADPARFAALIDNLYGTPWVVYAKRPFAGSEQVYRYLGRYTHRVGLSNQRMQALDARGVTFRTKGSKTVTLAPDVFIGRFLQHVLPPRFVKIRHYGLHASGNATTRLPVARAILERQAPVPPPAHPAGDAARLSWREILLALTGVDAGFCPHCGCQLERRPLPKGGLHAHRPTPRDTS
jgi:hypothetical protein